MATDNHPMGLAVWLVSGIAVWGLARALSFRRRRWWSELALALATSIAAGVTATALDFGGWSTPEWRAALFAGCASLAAVGIFRLLPARNKQYKSSV